MKLTIKQIAEMAGVSATVSQILIKAAGLSEETRKRVLDIVNKYHYNRIFASILSTAIPKRSE